MWRLVGLMLKCGVYEYVKMWSLGLCQKMKPRSILKYGAQEYFKIWSLGVF